MMGSHWLLWTMILTSSSSVEGLSDAEGKSSLTGTCLLDLSPSSAVQNVTPASVPVLQKDEGPEREAHPDGSRDRKELYRRDDYLAHLEISRIQKIRHHLNTSKAETSAKQALRAVERRELKKDDLVLAGYSREPVLNPAKTVNVTKTKASVEIKLESTLCRGTDINNSHEDLAFHSRRRRSPFMRDAGLTSCRNCSLALSLAKASGGDLSLVELVLYLISLTSGRQFYLVYDDVTPGVEDVVRGALHEVLGDTILLPYEPSLLLLTEVLTSNYQVHPMRNVFILCSAQHIIDIFEQVREKGLESPTIQWFVIVDQDMTEDLSVLLREGTQVALAQRLTPQRARLFSSRVYPDGQMRFGRVGLWSETQRIHKTESKGRLIPNLRELYSDLRGRQLVLTTEDNWPFCKIKQLKNGTVVPVSGIEVNLINTLSEALNFTYKLIRPPDGKWGGPQADGTVTGLVGQVARHEAHATFCELTITGIRETVVDFTMPYYLEFMTLVSPAPKEKNRAFVVLSPFTVEVWLYILVVTVLMGPLLYMVSRLLVVYLGEEDGPHYSLQSFSFNMFRNLVIQGNVIDSHRWSLRFTFFCWYLFCLYIYVVYSGTLTAALAVTSFEKPINSLYDLARAKRDGYTIATAKDTNYETTFKRATTGIYEEVWQLFNHEDRDKSFFPNRVIGMDMVEKHKYVYISAMLGLRLEATQRGREKFYIARETFLPQGYGIACNSGSPFKDVFSSILVRLIEVGLVDKWMNDELNKVYRYVSTSSSSGPKAISLQHLQAAFFIVAMGFTIAATALALEIVVGVLQRRTKLPA